MKYIQLPVQLFFDITDALNEIPEEMKTTLQRKVEHELYEKMDKIEAHIKYSQKLKGEKQDED